ncbi:hypothetical protein [Psychrobacillus sp. FSL K6-2843]|uniref:hypothetical protein n=1 Tax=Psychrobacillus sp. FSL K6-2843 TaxID=2921549 RepID=UPI00315ACC53
MLYQDLMKLKNIDLIGKTELQVNSLRLFFERRKVIETEEKYVIGDVSIEGFPVTTDESLPIIQIHFENYISYSVTNESFTQWDEYEEFEGKAFRVYSKSHFLDFVQSHTFASKDYPGPFKHYGMICIDHIVNIASTSIPIITEVEK